MNDDKEYEGRPLLGGMASGVGEEEQRGDWMRGRPTQHTKNETDLNIPSCTAHWQHDDLIRSMSDDRDEKKDEHFCYFSLSRECRMKRARTKNWLRLEHIYL